MSLACLGATSEAHYFSYNRKPAGKGSLKNLEKKKNTTCIMFEYLVSVLHMTQHFIIFLDNLEKKIFLKRSKHTVAPQIFQIFFFKW